MEWIFIILFLIVVAVYESAKNVRRPNQKLDDTKHSEELNEILLNRVLAELNARKQQTNGLTQAPKTPTPTVAPNAQHDWQQQEADNEKARECDVLKSRGDGYELHIGRMFERKGDLVIYNGLLRGYCRVSTGWMSYNYFKSQYLLEGCKSEILEFLQPD